MLTRRRIAVPFMLTSLLLCSAFAACSDDTGTSSGGPSVENDAGGGGPDVQPDVPVIVATDKDSKQSGKIIVAQTTDEGVVGATVTIAGKTAITNGSGDYEILVPRNTPYSMTVAQTGFYKLLEQELILKQETLVRGSTSLLKVETADFLAGLLPGRKKEKGFLVVKVNAIAPCATEEGSTLTIDPPGEAKVAYFSGALPSSTQTSVKGGTTFSAAFYNVEVGVPVKVAVNSPTCQQVPFPIDIPLDDANTVTYTGLQTTEPGEALAYLRVYVREAKVSDAGTD